MDSDKASRSRLIEIAYESQASHISSCLSCIDILENIYETSNIEKIKAKSKDRDIVLLSKGHAVLAQYVILEKNGLMDQDLSNYLRNGSKLYGHPNPEVENIEHTTGALGHGLPHAVGRALKRMHDGCGGKIFVVIGDGELDEGSNYEAMSLISKLNIKNIVILVDMNDLTQMKKSNSNMNNGQLERVLRSFNIECYKCDGHSQENLKEAITKARANKSTCIIMCKTIKGRELDLWKRKLFGIIEPLVSLITNKAILELSK